MSTRVDPVEWRRASIRASIIARKHPSPLPAHHVRQWANPARGRVQGAASGPRRPCLTTRAEARSRKPRRPPVRSWLICASLPCSGSGFPGLCPGSQLALGLGLRLRLALSHGSEEDSNSDERAASSELGVVPITQLATRRLFLSQPRPLPSNSSRCLSPHETLLARPQAPASVS